MADSDTSFEGYVRARLEDIGRVQSEQRVEVQFIRVQIAELSVTVAALKATARAWGVFAGILSGMASALVAKFWKT